MQMKKPGGNERYSFIELEGKNRTRIRFIFTPVL